MSLILNNSRDTISWILWNRLPSKYEQTIMLKLVYSDVPKILQESLYKKFKIFIIFIFLNETRCSKYTLQRQQRQHCGFQFLILVLNFNKDLVLSKSANLQTFWTLSNYSSLGLCEMIAPMVK